ncbi:MAG: twitching motility protein PilT [Acidobacteria bacterium OLB17]|nr:MAG: twitching motility protein PilT [Acidobacteria bacterium OLB17]MCZ2391179.1 VapC toxin family PIN domain ribonuclease [Acidobacteriota bacterium]
MRALLDVNVLVALLDPEHSFHERAHEVWSEIGRSSGWASCPITQNGVIRILSNERYPGASDFSKADVFAGLSQLIQNSDHEFWPDEISLLDRSRFDPEAIFGHKQLTDIYLLGLAMHKRGKFITFDQRVPVGAFLEPTSENLRIV